MLAFSIHKNIMYAILTNSSCQYFVEAVLNFTVAYLLMNHVMRKPVYALCKQQKRRSACASQSDQRLCCLLPG